MIHLIENRFQMGLHSSAIFGWWLYKLFWVLVQVLNQYGDILIADLEGEYFTIA